MKFLTALDAVLTGDTGLWVVHAAIVSAALYTIAFILDANGLPAPAVVAIWLALFPTTITLGCLATGLSQELRADA